MNKIIFRFLVAVATVAAVGFAATGCGTVRTGSGNITITDIPDEFNGVWASAVCEDEDDEYVLLWAQSFNMRNGHTTFSQIADGEVSMSIWPADKSNGWNGNGTLQLAFHIVPVSRYRGGPWPEVLKTIVFDAVEFENGNATISFGDGEKQEFHWLLELE